MQCNYDNDHDDHDNNDHDDNDDDDHDDCDGDHEEGFHLRGGGGGAPRAHCLKSIQLLEYQVHGGCLGSYQNIQF